MKKLLILLSSIFTVGTLGINVVSCSTSNKYDKKDGSGNSYIYFLPNSNGKNSYFSTGDAWNNLGLTDNKLSEDPTLENKLSPTIRNEINQNIMKMFNLSAFYNIGHTTDAQNSALENVAQFGDLPTIFNNRFGILESQVDNLIQSKKDSEGKNWSKWLSDNYDGDENKYKAFLYEEGDGSQSASSMLSSLLVEKYQNDYSYDLSTTIDGSDNTLNLTSMINEDLNGKVNIENTEITTWKQIAYATLGVTLDESKVSDFKASFEKDYADTTATSYNDLIGKTSSYDDDSFQYLPLKNFGDNNNYLSPDVDENGNFSFDYNSSLNGMLSPSQEFIESSWFQTLHPLAVSQILIKYDNEGSTTFDLTKNNLKNKNWSNLFSSDTITNINKLITNAHTSSSDNIWGNVMADVNSLSDSNISSTYESNLLTTTATSSDTDGFANDNMKSAIYNSILGYHDDTTGNDIKLNSKDNVPTIDIINDDDLIPSEIQSNSQVQFDGTALINNDMFQIINLNKTSSSSNVDDNVVIYFDSLGLHIVHVDGIKYLQNRNEVTSGIRDEFLINYTKEKQNENIRKYSDFFSSNDSSKLKSDSSVFNNLTNSDGDYLYLDWLNNYSYSNESNSDVANPNLVRPYKYDLESELKTYASFDATQSSIDLSSQNMWFWQYELIKWYETGGATSISDEKWINKFLNFNDSITAQNIKFLFEQQLRESTENLNSLYQNNLQQAFVNIQKNTSTNSKGPQGYINLKDYNTYNGYDANDLLWNSWDAN